MNKTIVITLLLLTLNPVVGNCQPKGHTLNWQQELTNKIIKELIITHALEHRVKPSAALAVAHIESRKGTKEFRVGKAGKYWLPMGIYDPNRSLGADSLDRNIYLGVKALARYGPVNTEAELKKTLKKYNASFNLSYWSEIKKAERRYRKELEDEERYYLP